MRVELSPKPGGGCHSLLMQDSGEDGSLGEVAGPIPTGLLSPNKEPQILAQNLPVAIKTLPPTPAPRNCWGEPGA